MKKKLLYLIILGFITIIPNNVEGASTTCTGKLSLNRIHNPGTGNRYWDITITGANGSYKALCTDPGLRARTGTVCKLNTGGTVGLSTQSLQALTFDFSKYNLPLAARQELEIEAGHGNLTNETAALILSQNGYSPTYSTNLASNIVSSLSNSPVPPAGSYYLLDCGSGYQHMLVSSAFCDDDDDPPSCPGGQMVKNGSIGDCQVSSKLEGESGGNPFYFSNVATSGPQANIHKYRGEDLGAPVGAYCRVYCEEEGYAILPGALGEAIQLGSYIIWPTSNSNYSSKFQPYFYPLKFKGKLSCQMAVMPDDGNMPVGCTTDPVKEYRTSYLVIEELWNQKDYNDDTYEYVRKEYIGRTTSPGDLCEANYDTGKSCIKTTKTVVGSNGGKFKYCYSIIEKRLGDEKALLATKEAEVAKWPCSSDEKVLCGIEETCVDKPSACADGKKTAEKARDAQKTIVNNFNNALNAIKNSRTACTNYVDHFEKVALILHEMHLCGKYQIDDSVYRFNSSASLNYSDETYKNVSDVTIDSQSKSAFSSPKVEIIDGSIAANLIPNVQYIFQYYTVGKFKELVESGLKERTFSVTKKDTYTLKTGYRYIDKDKLKYVKSKDGLKNYININKEVIPTSYDNKIGKDYYLTLLNIRFGQAGFGDGKNYSCKQKFVKNSDLCVCPENTVHAGKDLSCMLINMTCADAKAKYCDDEHEFPDDPEKCNLYCDYPYQYISIMPCVNAGGSIQQCKSSDICNPIECKNTKGVVDDSMNDRFRVCVQIKITQGMTRKEAIDFCDPIACNLNKNIIYRTIKLENPFPSVDADVTFNKKLSVGMFNNTIKGRYPGANWNSEIIVKKIIRNNRGVSGSELYQKKEPLYTFKLTGPIIESIRNYNDSQKEGYNDFNGKVSLTNDKMICMKNNSAACVSSFVHNRAYGLTSGTCSGSLNKNSFYTCDD